MLDDVSFLNKVTELYNLVYINEPILLIDIDGTILFAGNKIEDLTHIKVITQAIMLPIIFLMLLCMGVIWYYLLVKE